jgi:uncharacterized protein (DUF1330 family)
MGRRREPVALIDGVPSRHLCKHETRIIVIEFRDYATAECYQSPEYAKAIELRKGSAVVADGYHGPQPADA